MSLFSDGSLFYAGQSAESYPPAVKKIVGVLMSKSAADPLKAAYELARTLHAGQAHNQDGLPYVTHVLRVYDMARCCTAGMEDVHRRNAILTASLLHDGKEKFRETALKLLPAEKEEEARAEAQQLIERRMHAMPEYPLMKSLIDELTDPVRYPAKDGVLVSKEAWQIEHASTLSAEAQLLKLCDMSAKLVSVLEENMGWDKKKIDTYTKKADAIAKVIRERAPTEGPMKAPAENALKLYKNVREQFAHHMHDYLEKSSGEPTSQPIVPLVDMNIIYKNCGISTGVINLS